MRVANIGGAKAAIVEYRGQTYYFLFNGLAMFALEAEFGGRGYFESIAEKSQKGLESLTIVSKILAEQGEVARRSIRLTPAADITDTTFAAPSMLQPHDILALRDGCINAINLGYTREVQDEDEEIDLGLLELQKKRKV